MRAGICVPIKICAYFKFRVGVAWLARLRVRGIVIGRNVLFAEPASEIAVELFRHELEHAYQQLRHGRFRFYLNYFLWSLRYGYVENPYEVEARWKSHAPLNEAEEQLLWKLRNG